MGKRRETSASVRTTLPKQVNWPAHVFLATAYSDAVKTTLNVKIYVFLVSAATGGSAFIYQMAMGVLKNPSGQVLLAAWIAALAGLAAWYLMWLNKRRRKWWIHSIRPAVTHSLWICQAIPHLEPLRWFNAPHLPSCARVDVIYIFHMRRVV